MILISEPFSSHMTSPSLVGTSIIGLVFCTDDRASSLSSKLKEFHDQEVLCSYISSDSKCPSQVQISSENLKMSAQVSSAVL